MANRTIRDQPPIHLPALMAIARDPSPLVVIQKSAQVGISELLVTMALHAADTGYAGRGNVMMLMPTDGQMADFVHGRIDQAIQDSAYIRGRMVSEPPKRKGIDSVRMKRIGRGVIYMRGSESLRQIASVDADLAIADEADQMGEDVIGLLQRRIASSRQGRVVVASTPRYPGAGINALFLQSDQHRYYLPCPACQLSQPLLWEHNVDRDALQIVCRDCRHPMDVLAQGEWIAEAPGNRTRGYHLSRLYAPWLDLRALVEASEGTTYFEIRRFQNDDLGEAFVPPGGMLTANELDKCRADYSVGEYQGQECVAGVDVGNLLHVVIRDRQTQQLWFAGTVTPDELARLLARFHVISTMIDSRPDFHLMSQFARSHPEFSVWLATYTRHDGTHVPERGMPKMYHFDRTTIFDESVARFRDGTLSLPAEARSLGGHVKGDGFGEYYREMMASNRTIVETNGTHEARWVPSGPDHYGNAENYVLGAMKVLPEPYRDYPDPPRRGGGDDDFFGGEPTGGSWSLNTVF